MEFKRKTGLPRHFSMPHGKKFQIHIKPLNIRRIRSEISVPKGYIRLAGSNYIFSEIDIFLPTLNEGKIVRSSVCNIREWAEKKKDKTSKAITQRLHKISVARKPFDKIFYPGPIIVGILNITPDSFHDGGKYLTLDDAIRRGKVLRNEGASILEVGGESSRPGAEPVSEKTELRRILPVIKELSKDGNLISVDTRRPEVMEAALEAGARVVNDITALSSPGAVETIIKANAYAIIMHMQGVPKTMQRAPKYGFAPYEILCYLENRVIACEEAGLSHERILIDPGVGFGKSDFHNFAILNSIASFHGIGCGVMIGISHKSFIGRSGKTSNNPERLPGTITATLHAIEQGVQFHRVHNVMEIKQAMAVSERIFSGK